MPIDIVAPDGNEKELMLMAAKLGYNGLVLAYEGKVPKIETHETKLTISLGIISADRKQVMAAKQKGYLTLAPAADNVREILEHVHPDIIFRVEDSEKGDFIHHRNSGLNQVFAKIAAQKKIVLGNDFHHILNTHGGRQAMLMGRVAQNISLSRKYGIKMRVFSLARDPYEMRPPHDLLSFYRELGLLDKHALF